jgi:hypothetical protein
LHPKPPADWRNAFHCLLHNSAARIGYGCIRAPNRSLKSLLQLGQRDRLARVSVSPRTLAVALWSLLPFSAAVAARCPPPRSLRIGLASIPTLSPQTAARRSPAEYGRSHNFATSLVPIFQPRLLCFVSFPCRGHSVTDLARY